MSQRALQGLSKLRSLRMEQAERAVALARKKSIAASTELLARQEVVSEYAKMRPEREAKLFERYRSASSAVGALDRYRHDMNAIVNEGTSAADRVTAATKNVEAADTAVIEACSSLSKAAKKVQKLDIITSKLKSHIQLTQLHGEEDEMDDWMSVYTSRIR